MSATIGGSQTDVRTSRHRTARPWWRGPWALLAVLGGSASCAAPVATDGEVETAADEDYDAATPSGANEPDAAEGDTDEGPGQIGSGDVEKEKLTGFAQKGPFLNGANLTLLELGQNLAPTGRTFQTNIIDDTGAFAFRDVALDNSVAVIRVDGFFLNEVLGKKSGSQITLSALTDLGVRDSANINLLSHLEKARVEYLIEDGASYEDAKHQALDEIFTAFSLELDGAVVSESLDLTAPGANNAGLLAISSAILGYRSDAVFSETLANIAGDIRTDGTIDSSAMLTDLVNHARRLDANQIRENLEARYESLGQTVEVPDFSASLGTFLSANAAVPQESLFDYPEGSLLEVLFNGQDGMDLSTSDFDLSIDEAGAPMRLVINSIDGGIWYYQLGGSGFLVSDFDNVGCTQTFDLTEFGTLALLTLQFGGGEYEVEVYEGSLSVPAWTRHFTAQGAGGFVSACSSTPRSPTMGSHGGACYADSSCDSGLECGSSKECDQAGLATCCLPAGGGGTVPVGPGPGGSGVECEGDGSCGPGQTCVEGDCGPNGCCIAAGTEFEACFEDDTCNPGFACVEGPECAALERCCYPAAGELQPCEDGSNCNPGLTCATEPSCDSRVDFGMCCVSNDPGGPIGPGPSPGCGSDGSCAGGYECLVSPECGAEPECCLPVGGEGELCADGDVCDSGLVCSHMPENCSNMDNCCVPTGGEGQMCGDEDSCDPGLVCHHGLVACGEFDSCCVPADNDAGAAPATTAGSSESPVTSEGSSESPVTSAPEASSAGADAGAP